MNRIVTFLLLNILFLTFTLPITAQKKVREPKLKVSSEYITEFSRTEAFSDGNGVFISWEMITETNNLGFYVYRISNNGQELITKNVIPGSLFKTNEEIAFGKNYSFFDVNGNSNDIYIIETLDLSGERILSNQFSAKYVNDLREVAGKSSFEIAADFQKNDFRIERNELNFTKEIHAEIAENALQPNLENQRFISTLPGVKIGVKKEGIYRVSRTELENAGFDVKTNSENWQLFKNGNEQSMIVGDNGDFIEFYGQGIDTIESGTQIYFLINGDQSGKRIGNSIRRRIGGNVVAKSYDQSFYKADRAIYLNTVRNGDANNFFSSNVINTTGTTVSFELDGIDQNIQTSILRIGVQGVTTTPHNINVTLNNVPLDPMAGSNLNLFYKTYEIPTSLLIEGQNNLNLKVPSVTSDLSLVESVRISFAREFKAKQNALSFYALPFKQSELSGFTNRHVRVFDITQPDSPNVITNLQSIAEEGNTRVIIPANRTKRMFALTEEAVLAVDSITENTVSNLSAPTNEAKLVIISHKNWLNEAEQWAEYRRTDGFSVEVVRVDDIFDEFNYGITSANSIRQFLQFAKQNWSVSPDYVLILGDITWDPRNYLGSNDFNFVPTRMFDTAYEETGSDEGLADFNDDGLAELAVGRIPARTPTDVLNALNKTMTFEETSNLGFSRGALFASDLPNGYDFAGMSQRLANELPPETTSQMINRADTNARANLLAALNSGKFVVNYSGHGSPSLWAASSFYSSPDVANMSNGTNYSIFTMLTCLNGYFINPTDSLAELVLKKNNGGGAAVWASSGKTTPDVQEVLARRFYQKLAQGNIPRIGDLIKDAKQNVFGGRDVRLSWTLLGDPTLKVR